jgi:hypothetical protein
MHRGPRSHQFGALLEKDIDRPRLPVGQTNESVALLVADLLWEMGAADVVESPRQLRGLLALHDRLSNVRHSRIGAAVAPEPFTDWAWMALPWQDT